MKKVDKPMACVRTGMILFNTSAREIIEGRRIQAFEIRLNSEYILFKPAMKERGLTSGLFNWNGWLRINMTSELLDRKLKRGNYQLFKCGDSFAIKRYEPLEVLS